MPNNFLLNDKSSSSKQFSTKCQTYCLGKLHRVSLKLTHHRSTQPLQLIYFDVWGPAHMSSFLSFKYFVIFIDDYSLFTWIYPIKCKSEVLTIFK